MTHLKIIFANMAFLALFSAMILFYQKIPITVSIAEKRALLEYERDSLQSEYNDHFNNHPMCGQGGNCKINKQYILAMKKMDFELDQYKEKTKDTDISKKIKKLAKIMAEKDEVEISFLHHIVDQKCYQEYPAMKEESIRLNYKTKEVRELITEINEDLK